MPIKLKYLIALALSVQSIDLWAMQALDDTTLAQETGQQGITVAIGTKGNSGTIGFDSISLEDTDGSSNPFYNNTYTGKAALSYITQGSGAGVTFYNGASTIAEPLTIVIDADGNANNPVLNVGLLLNNNLSRINLNPFALSLTSTTAPPTPVNTRRDIVKVGGTGIDVVFKTGSRLGLNMQLGAQPQGHMFVFTGGQILQVKNDPSSPIELLSYSGICTITCTPTSSLKLNFNLTANAASTNGIQLAGMYIDVNSQGLTVGKTGKLDKFDLNVTDVVAGSKTAALDTNIFNGLKNGAIGNFGAIGISVSDLKVNVKGM